LYKTLNFVEARRLFFLRCFLISQSFKERFRSLRLLDKRHKDKRLFYFILPATRLFWEGKGNQLFFLTMTF
jgi:hypothetical protein